MTGTKQTEALPPHLGTVCYKTSDGNQSCDRIYNMTDYIPRQAVIERIEALSGNGAWASSHVAISRALAAINAIPAVTVTDDMVERAAKAWCERDDSYSSYGYTAYLRYARELLVAALGE